LDEFEYSLEDIEELEVPSPPQRKRRRVEIEDDEDESDRKLDEEDEEEDDEEEQDEDEEEEEDHPRTRKRKKKGAEGSRLIPIVVGTVIFVVVVGCSVGGYLFTTRKGSAPDPAKAMEMIKARGGNYKLDETDPDKPVIEVSLMGTDADNGDLKMLRAFPKLKKLDMSMCTKINNVGLEWLVDLKEIRILKLGHCSHVTDGGMPYVGQLTNMEELYLDQCNVTDRGLADLKGLKKLKKLGLSGSMLASGRGLQASIPGLEILN